MSEQIEADESPLKDFMLIYLMPDKCYDNFFVNLNFLHVPCLKIVLSKTVGLWIILGTVMAQLPQLLKVWRRRSAEGLSLTSTLLHLYSISGPLVYCMANNFPLSAWGERLFMALQTAIMGFLILHYRGSTQKGVLLLLVYSGVLLLLGSYGTTATVSVMQSSTVLALIASKATQAGTNYSNGHTGQLSTLSVLLVWAGSLALIFVSLQDTGKSLSTLGHILSACVSCILLTQVLRCRKISSRIKSE